MRMLLRERWATRRCWLVAVLVLAAGVQTLPAPSNMQLLSLNKGSAVPAAYRLSSLLRYACQ